MPTVHINGKWLRQPFTGVQRYSDEIAKNLTNAQGFRFVLHVPKGASAPEWADKATMTTRVAPVSGLLFEQFYLPVVSRGGLLLTFGGTAPLIKRRQLVTFHDATPFRFPATYTKLFVAFYFVAYFILSRTALIVMTVSEFSRGELAEVLRTSPRRFMVVPCAANGLSEIEPNKPDLEWRTGSYLVVGTYALHKNLVGPVRALSDSGRTAVVVGAAADDRVYSSVSATFGPGVTIAKRLTDAELAWLYRNARALVFPSLYEGFGLPVLEAQTMRCPVVASTAASIPEVAGDGALYFEPEAPEDLLKQLDELESSDSVVDGLVDRALGNAARFSWETSAERIVEWLHAQ
ncbi:glycosyltransferase family 4 protein [Williamsia sterculiae]|uniref:Glycosyltransferase involved in cell wall bisynthesis n=1 Tax=Williamsia sterculiae TaxID=1344003 RepID=A0A1N7CHS5_9NOCA|nr:glycosyltransferase family 1 protein [Williamsia sterculiae]SIR63171.1 Glycosyltransferase involved in cell wall bisynthesis [Williamsia sterculiae]